MTPTILSIDDIAHVHGRVAIDFETTGLDPFHDESLGLGIWAEDAGIIGFVPTYTEDDLRRIAHMMLFSWEPKCFVMAHNLKFEWHWLRADERLLNRHRWFDTQIAEQQLNEEFDLTLEATEARRLKTRSKKALLALAAPYGGIRKAAQWPQELLAEYCVNDSRITYLIAQAQSPKLRSEQLTQVVAHQHEYLKEIFRIERRGLFYEPAAGTRTRKKIQQLVRTGDQKLVETLQEAGLDYTTAPKYTSPQQLSRLLYQELGLHRPEVPPELAGSPKAAAYRTKTGTAKELLAQLDHPAVRIIEELRKVIKIGSYLKAYDALGVAEDGGRALHPSFNITGTITGRLSCSKPNLQQVSDRSVGNLLLAPGDEPLHLRRVFRARDGYRLVSIDYRQMEMAAFAMIAREMKMLEIVRSGGDIHQGVSELLLGGYDAEKRRIVKTLNFGLLYGLGIGALATDLGVSHKEAQQLMALYQGTFPRIRPFFREVETQLANQGYVRYWSGRKRRIPEKRFHYRGVNSIVQGGCAEIMGRAVVRVGKHLRKAWPQQAHMVAIIHDEILMEVADDVVSQVVPEVREIMAVPDLLGTPFSTDAEWGTYWSLPEVQLA